MFSITCIYIQYLPGSIDSLSCPASNLMTFKAITFQQLPISGIFSQSDMFFITLALSEPSVCSGRRPNVFVRMLILTTLSIYGMYFLRVYVVQGLSMLFKKPLQTTSGSTQLNHQNCNSNLSSCSWHHLGTELDDPPTTTFL